MKSLRQLNNKSKICGGTLLAFGLGALASGWLLGQLDAIASSGKVAAAATGAFVLLGIGLAAAFLLGLWLAAEAARPVRRAGELAARMAGGELDVTLEIDYGGDTALPLQQLMDLGAGLQSTMRALRGGAQSLVQGTGEIAQASQDLSARTEQQAAALEETASSMEELTATVRQNADHAHEASKLAVTASEVAVKGGAVVSEVVGTMASINESSKRIAEIIGVIDGIAFQTNILALNAAVEAARAGEQGRGFAVVASEVRSLAQRSAAAAREIKELIDDSVEKVNAGTALADKAGNTMNEVVASVKRVTGIIGEIADASAEQTSGIDQVNQAIAAMDQATQQNAALVEQSAAAAAGMREQADSLTRLVGAFCRPAPAPASQLPLSMPRPPLAAPQAVNRAQAAQPRPVRAPRRTRGNSHAVPESEWEEF